MHLLMQKLGGVVQLIAWIAGLFSIWGWFFWLMTLVHSGKTFAQLRVDPEFGSMIALAIGLSYLAPLAFITGVVALLWRPRYIACTAIVLGAVGTCWLAFVP